jgi:hypothetical protein
LDFHGLAKDRLEIRGTSQRVHEAKLHGAVFLLALPAVDRSTASRSVSEEKIAPQFDRLFPRISRVISKHTNWQVPHSFSNRATSLFGQNWTAKSCPIMLAGALHTLEDGEILVVKIQFMAVLARHDGRPKLGSRGF